MEGEFFHPTHTIHSVDKLCASRGSKSIYTRLSAGIIVKDDRLWWTENGEWIIAGQFLKRLPPGTLEKDAGWKGKRDSEKKKKKTEERERMGGERKRKWRKRLKVEERGGEDIFLERMKAFSPRFGVQLIIFRGNADIPLSLPQPKFLDILKASSRLRLSREKFLRSSHLLTFPFYTWLDRSLIWYACRDYQRIRVNSNLEPIIGNTSRLLLYMFLRRNNESKAEWIEWKNFSNLLPIRSINFSISWFERKKKKKRIKNAIISLHSIVQLL